MNHYVQAWKNSFNFSGRARRREFWLFPLVNTAFLFGAVFFAVFAFGSAAAETPEAAAPMMGVMLVMQLFILATFVPALALQVRRCHDIGKPWTYILTSFIPIYNIYSAFVLAFQDSDPGVNRFGPNPKGAGNSVASPTGPSDAPSVSSQFRPQAPAEPEDYQNPFAKSA